MSMDLHIEPEELRDSARRLLENEVDRRAAYGVDSNHDRAALRSKMIELGWMLLMTPVELDGLGQSFRALAPVYEEFGRALAPLSLAHSLASVDALAGAPAANAFIGRIGMGEARCAIGASEAVGVDGARVSGTLIDQADTADATHLLLFPRASDAPAMLIDIAASGVSVRETPTWDKTRSLAEITLDNAEAAMVLSGPEARLAGAVAFAHLDLAIACDSIGGAGRALTEAIAYMGTRHQFNRPIGSFQALKHRAADLKVGLEVARAFTTEACAAFAERSEGWASIAGQAKLLCAEIYRAIAEEAVQFHGGIGFTWEHDCHLFLKRALLNEMLGGTPEQYRDRVAPDILRRAFSGSAIH